MLNQNIKEALIAELVAEIAAYADCSCEIRGFFCPYCIAVELEKEIKPKEEDTKLIMDFATTLPKL